MISRSRVCVGFILAVSFLACPAVQAVEAEVEKPLSVDEIVENSNRVAYYQGEDGRADVSMTITDSQGRERNREFVILRRDEPPPEGSEEAEDADRYCGDQMFYVYFQRPADVNKMVFMVKKHVDKDDERWLYLPALDLVKPVAAGDRRTSFAGSDFFYEDVSGRNTDEDTHELIETTKDFYVLKNTPKEPKTVEFAHYKMWTDRKTFVTVKVEYYDREGKKYRVYEALKAEKVQGYWTITKARMSDLRTKGETVVQYSDVRYNIDFPKDIFSERYLRRPPRKYLR